MAEKAKSSAMDPGEKLKPMKLFSTWEVEKSTPNCIARVCSLTITRLVVNKPIETDLIYVIIAVKMQNSKRVLRSNEIEVPPSGVLDVKLDLSFMLQYPHFLKRDGNKLHILLQRRKRYKNRTILGYKTLGLGQVSMAQVLQHSVDRDLNLYADEKERKKVVAKVTMVSLSSQPVDHEGVQNGHRKMTSSDIDRSPDVDNYSEEEEIEEDQSSNDELSDSEPVLDDDSRGHGRKGGRGKARPIMTRQRNLKQKFVALLKKFKISDEVLDSEADHEMLDPDTNQPDIDDLIDQLEEDISDSDPEMDTMSVKSTPKPRLRPFFTGRGSNNEIDRHSLSFDQQGRTSDDNSSNSHADRDTDMDFLEFTTSAVSVELPGTAGPAGPNSGLEPPAPKAEVFNLTVPSPAHTTNPKLTTHYRVRSTSYKEKKHNKGHRQTERRSSVGCVDQSPRKALLDQLGSVLGGSDDKLPDNLLLVNTAEWQGQLFTQKIQDIQLRLICTCSEADVKAVVNFLVAKIQKFVNFNSKNPKTIRMGIAGGDSYINSVLRPYVEQFSARSPDWQNYVRFMIIPFGCSQVGKYLAMLDPTYASLFMDSQWKDTFDKPEATKLDWQEIQSRVSKYLSTAPAVIHIPIAEAMVMCKGKGSDDESSQIFVPFLSEVKIGSTEVLNASVDYDEGQSMSTSLSSSPPMNITIEKQREHHTPPNSPSVGGAAVFSGTPPTFSSSGGFPSREYVELQVDYWNVVSRVETTDKGEKSSKKDSNKVSMKTAFKSLHVCRLPSGNIQLGDLQSLSFIMSVVTREKKQKIRIGKKSKIDESKSQTIEGISRLICTSKSQNHSLKVVVDGVEWTGVKFFQLSSQWQTHMKHFPIGLFNHLEPVSNT